MKIYEVISRENAMAIPQFALLIYHDKYSLDVQIDLSQLFVIIIAIASMVVTAGFLGYSIGKNQRR